MVREGLKHGVGFTRMETVLQKRKIEGSDGRVYVDGVPLVHGLLAGIKAWGRCVTVCNLAVGVVDDCALL